jgi:5'-3' exonuclease
MGIPRFFYWLYKEYPNVLTKIQKNETFLKHRINVDTYALDLNAIVHPICQQVFKYGQYKNGLNNNEFRSLLHKKEVSTNHEKNVKEYPSKRIECYNKICEKIDELVKIVNPNTKIILAIDGTAGMSKQYQQRQRRYRAVIEKKENNNIINIDNFNDFDSNEITTGSIFMNELSECITEFIKHKIKMNEWKHLDIYFSSEQVQGEGEHKIIHLLKQYSSFGSYCIHSPDADLIMLSLASLCTHQFKNSYILRENIYQNVNCKYFAVNVNLFNDIIINKFKNHVINGKKQDLCDFIFYCFFFGNDFLPEIPVMITNKNGIDVLFTLYRDTLINYGNLTSIKNEKVVLNIDSCIYFFEQLSKNEELLLKNKLNLNKTNENCDNNQKCDFDLNEHKLKFYKDKFNFDIKDPIILKKQINNLCKEYLKGTQFVLSYYLYDIPDWYWFYPFHYSPFFSDIYEYLKYLKTEENTQKINKTLSFKFEKNEPLTPFEQLLAVLPPESSNILPKPFSELMTSKESDIINFYPDTSSIKVEIKSEYEKTILVPFIDVKLLRKTFKKILENNNNLSEEELNRNKFKTTITYINTTTY